MKKQKDAVKILLLSIVFASSFCVADYKKDLEDTVLKQENIIAAKDEAIQKYKNTAIKNKANYKYEIKNCEQENKYLYEVIDTRDPSLIPFTKIKSAHMTGLLWGVAIGIFLL